MQMRINIQPPSPGIAIRIRTPGADNDIANPIVSRRRRPVTQPVLRGCMSVPEQQGRKTRDGVIEMGDADLDTRLSRDEVGEGVVSDAGGAVGVEVDGVAG